MNRRQALRQTLSAFSLASLLVGSSCRQLVGIDSSDGASNAGKPATGGSAGAGASAGNGGSAGSGASSSAPSAQCMAYCASAQQVCTGPSALYATEASCLGFCALLAPGDPNEPVGDTVACRANQLAIARQVIEPGGEADYCAHAGPATNGACAANCDTYCSLYGAACSGTIIPDDCVEKCAGLQDTAGFDVNANYYGDTLECRFVHLSAATIDPTVHCPYAALPANGPCLGMDPALVVPDCESFCQLETTECTGDDQQYESVAQCMAVCNALPKGTADDQSGNTVACRKYHSYNAILDPAIHCSHTGPGGDGHCGPSAAAATGSTGNCESYCMLLSAACSADFNATYSGLDACELDCSKLDGAGDNSNYSIRANGNNVQCRLLHVARALSTPTECAAAEGSADPCR
jgi:hypothetical protein